MTLARVLERNDFTLGHVDNETESSEDAGLEFYIARMRNMLPNETMEDLIAACL